MAITLSDLVEGDHPDAEAAHKLPLQSKSGRARRAGCSACTAQGLHGLCEDSPRWRVCLRPRSTLQQQILWITQAAHAGALALRLQPTEALAAGWHVSRSLPLRLVVAAVRQHV